MIEFNIAKGQRFSNIRQYVEKFSKQLGLNGKEIMAEMLTGNRYEVFNKHFNSIAIIKEY